MSIASWFHLPKSYRSTNRTRTPRQPTRPRLFLESLEDRLLLSAASSNLFGGLNNGSLNFNAPAIGLTLPTTGQQNGGVGLPTLNTFQPVGAVAFAAPFAQSQLYDQFRVFGVNSQGQGNQFQLGEQPFILGAFGFGSGVQPNAPWMGNAYNLGLTNHQFNYSSQSDNGFQSVPPWTRPTAQVPQDDPNVNEVALNENPLEWKTPAAQPTKEAEQDNEQAEQAKSDGQAAELKRGDPLVEEALFSESPYVLMVHQATPPTKQALDHDRANLEESPVEDDVLPSSLWLSALAPAPIAVFMAGFPALEAAGATCEVDAGDSASE